MRKQHYYWASCDVGEGVPSYDFVITATTLKQAEKKTRKILKLDYPENWKYNKNSFTVGETTPQQFIDDMTIII